MKVFIAEKPSMARELAKCLPPPRRRDNGCIRTGGGIVTWAYGHVLQQAEPEAYNAAYKKWRAEDLPIIPKEWKLFVSPASKEQFEIIRSLINEADSIVNAGDPDREGQLLIDEILDYVGNTKPVERILLNALDEKSIRESLGNLRDNKAFKPLKDSALARSRADWLMGMNLSRAYTLAARRQGYRGVYPVGRVKTPTLALVVRRQRELDNFKPVTYYIVKADFNYGDGVLSARWQPAETQAGLDPEGRCIRKDIAARILEKLAAEPEGMVTERKVTHKKENQRLPHSLSSLQIEAGRKYGYSPQQVLDTAQQLYERKFTTYPRSDCEYLPLNQRRDALGILSNLAGLGDRELSVWAGAGDSTVKSRAWNDTKITAHHAIIPTTVVCPYTRLTEMQRNIYFLIARAYIAQFYAPHEYDSQRIVIRAAEENFVARGRTITVAGWKQLYSRDKHDDGDEEKGELPVLRKGAAVTYTGGMTEEKETKPPPRFTASTLLAAMKEIYKYVKDDTLKKKLKEVQGIGTEATRATIINELIARKFLLEEGRKKYLFPGDSAYVLIDSLPDELSYPDETALWEERLHQMSLGKDDLQSFLKDQTEFLTRLIAKAAVTETTAAGSTGKRCPDCGKIMIERSGKFGDFYGCTGYPQCRHTERIMETAAAEVSDYACPRCKTGRFIKRDGPYGAYWVCSSPACNTRCADVDGVPSIYVRQR